MIKLPSIKCLLIIMLIGAACKEPFNPTIPPSQTNYLVIEGFINANGSTTINLSRTQPVKDSSQLQPDLNAQVTIEGEDNSVFNVAETGNGTYTSASLVLNRNQKYRLHIKTSSGGEYLSEYAAIKPTPAIDSINWKPENDGVRIYVNTHDPQNNTRYYKWDYEETWEIHSRYVSYVKYENGSVGGKSLSETEKSYYCWQSQNSVSILTGSSAKLANDVISEAPVMFIPYESVKTSVRYSILIKQYSLDRKAFDFYKLVKSNTETLGSVYDPLPSEITGNVTCVSNPSEKVIGYITAATSDQKRIFISADDIHSRYKSDCESILVPNNPDSFRLYYDGQGYLPYQAVPLPPAPPKAYFSSQAICIDCTIRGTNVKPSFW